MAHSDPAWPISTDMMFPVNEPISDEMMAISKSYILPCLCGRNRDDKIKRHRPECLLRPGPLSPTREKQARFSSDPCIAAFDEQVSLAKRNMWMTLSLFHVRLREVPQPLVRPRKVTPRTEIDFSHSNTPSCL